MNQLLQGKPLTIFGDGKQTRAFSYITDVAPYIAASVNIPKAFNQVFNIGADKEYSVNELANTVIEVIGLKGSINYLPARNEVMDAYSDHTKAKHYFNITENKFTSLYEGLGKMASWAKKVGARSSSVFGNIEIEERLPSAWLEIKNG